VTGRHAPGEEAAVRYEFTFTEPVPDLLAAELPELDRSTVTGHPTTLYGRIEDMAHLHGLLARFRVLGLDMTDMHRLPD